MARSRGTVIVILGILLVAVAAVIGLTNLVILPFIVALHYLESLVHWLDVVWNL